jgi:hypothetical protein
LTAIIRDCHRKTSNCEVRTACEGLSPHQPFIHRRLTFRARPVTTASTLPALLIRLDPPPDPSPKKHETITRKSSANRWFYHKRLIRRAAGFPQKTGKTSRRRTCVRFFHCQRATALKTASPRRSQPWGRTI